MYGKKNTGGLWSFQGSNIQIGYDKQTERNPFSHDKKKAGK
jgi:hypothetical protein